MKKPRSSRPGKNRTPASIRAALGLACACVALQAQVVINEVFYNAPGDDLQDLQWIEFHNTGEKATDLSGWTLDDGKVFTFPTGASLDAGAYLIVALSPERFQATYDQPALGPLKRPLKRDSERLRLRDGRGELIDTARYKDEAPWPVTADGESASVERICPGVDGELPENWAGSLLPDTPKPSGSPGRKNDRYSASLPPIIVMEEAPVELEPDTSLAVRVEVEGEPARVELLYQVINSKEASEETAVPMETVSGRKYAARIPGQPHGSLVRYRIRALGQDGTVRFAPDEQALRPTLTVYVHEPWENAELSFAVLLLGGSDKEAANQPGFGRFGPPGRGPGRGAFSGPPAGGFGPGPGQPGERREDFRVPPDGGGRPQGQAPGAPGGQPPLQGGNARPGFGGPREGFEPTPEMIAAFEEMMRNGGPPPGMFRGGPRGGGFPGFGGPGQDTPKPTRGSSTLVYYDREKDKTRVFDHINTPPRNGMRGYRVFFHKDDRLKKMSSVNLIFEGNEYSLLAEAMAYDVYTAAGMPAPKSDWVRVWANGELLGYHVMVERVNKSFLRRHDISDEGNLYKIRWMGRGLEEQHEKRTHETTGHADLIDLVQQLEETASDPTRQWQVIQQHFDVAEVANYFAVNMVLSHWDGFFNNYFTYHDPERDKWLMFPWDQDKTWGYHDGLRPGEIFFDMPLTFGMEGDQPPGGGRGGPGGGFRGRRGFGGGAMWWRAGGYFSRPLLANPEFRQVFLQRVREIMETVYTPERYNPLIDAAVARLESDAALRSSLMGESGEAGRDYLRANAQALKDHIIKRREFLLNQPELKE